jgi:hypothetical protein
MSDSTQEQIKLEQERLKLIQEQTGAAKELTSVYEKQKKATGFLTADEKEILDISKQLYKVTSDIDKSINTRLSGTASVKDLTKQLNSLTLNQLNSNNELNKLQTEFTKKLDLSHQLKREGLKLSTDQKNAEEALGQKSSRVANLQRTINSYQERILDAQSKGDRSEVLRLNNLKSRATLAKNTASQQEKYYKEELNDINKSIKENKKKYDIIKGQADALQENKKNYENVIEEEKKEQDLLKQAIEKKKKSEALDVLKEKFNVKQIADMFTLAGVLKMILDSALRFNEISVKTSKSLGYGADNADRVTSNLVDMAQNSTNLNVTLKNAGEAMSQLNEVTGGVAEYSADVLETQIMLTKQLGLSGEEAAGIYKFSVLTGKSSEKVNDEMVAAFVNTRNAVKGSADFKTTMAAASKVSGQLSANLQNNPGLITKAVVQAQALGTSLEQTAAQGASLLNFESSISKELDAELLTGKQLNLERARAAALSGDQVTLAEELNKNVGTLSDFQKMNVLQQNALADAVGLTADQLSDQLRKQKIATEQGKSLAQITKEEALEAENRQAIQDKFNAAILKLQDIIGNLAAGPLSMFLDGLSTALQIIGYMAKPIEWIASIAGAIGKTFRGWAEAIGPFGFILKGIAGIAILIAAYGAYAALAWIPVVGPILGAAAAVAVMAKGFGALSSQKAGDMISPANGKTQVSTKEGGLFELSKNDDLMAGPGLASKSKGGESMQGPSIDLTPMIVAINAVKSSIDRLYDKDSSVHMDGKKVGTTLAQGSHKVA